MIAARYGVSAWAMTAAGSERIVEDARARPAGIRSPCRFPHRSPDLLDVPIVAQLDPS
ncbi:MAG TPA: hypothetical protein VI248_19755 [Kineosporiaceae bacterium]